MPKKLLIRKKLSKTDIDYRMSVPTKSLDAFGIRKGEHFKEIGVTDIHGERKRFRCSTRRTGLHPKPVLSSCWTAFAKDRGLRKGDEVSFFVMDDINGAKDLEFQIQARRKMKLFGKVFWTAPL
ncbi:B3 domain-containing transcription factor [Salix suchowensis]|nr:B3 domain-containing transcription factor [Salix suchowensis]